MQPESAFMNRAEGISTVYNGPSHVVLLGAGASIASTLHNPEPSGRVLPSMDNLIDVVGLGECDEVAALAKENGNFENVYRALYSRIEQAVREYFSSLKLPPTPTIYDYLVLSLRGKDLIATFNWDPFLVAAVLRNRRAAEMPALAFLHGNVAMGFSCEDDEAGPPGRFSATGREFIPTRLLYPITQKNYNSDGFIRREWTKMEAWMKRARRFTIFGYSAPESDVEAVELMSEAWGIPESRELEQVEIIDIRREDVVRERWDPFILSHHYDYFTCYFQSVLSQFPRRTGERFMHEFLPQTSSEAFQEPNPVPERFDTLKEMHDWFRPLVDAECRVGAVE